MISSIWCNFFLIFIIKLNQPSVKLSLLVGNDFFVHPYFLMLSTNKFILVSPYDNENN